MRLGWFYPAPFAASKLLILNYFLTSDKYYNRLKSIDTVSG